MLIIGLIPGQQKANKYGRIPQKGLEISRVKQLPKHRAVKLLTVIFFILLICFLARGWLRTTVIPSFVSWRYQSSLQRDFDNNDQLLGQPLRTLGIKAVQNAPASCSLNTAQYIFAEVGCQVYSSGEVDIIDQNYINQHLAYMEHLQGVLEKNGWHEDKSDNALDKFASLLSEAAPPFPNDYLGFISYQKQTKAGNYCSFEITRHPQLIVELSCNRTSGTVY